MPGTVWAEWHFSKIPEEVTPNDGNSTEFVSHESSHESGFILIIKSNLHKYNSLP